MIPTLLMQYQTGGKNIKLIVCGNGHTIIYNKEVNYLSLDVYQLYWC